jgi:hypothetical protein
MNKVHLLIGPVLFLLAEVILPNGSADPAARITIIEKMVLRGSWDIN